MFFCPRSRQENATDERIITKTGKMERVFTKHNLAVNVVKL